MGDDTNAWGISYSVNNLNQYTNAGSIAVTPDGNGNIRSRDGWTYTYDAQNRLRRAANGTVFLDFFYDGLNRQITRGVQTSSGSRVTFSVWDGWNLLEERGLGDVLQRVYFYGGKTDELACAFGGVQPNSWVVQDGRGNVSHIFNDSNNLVERYTYGLAGEPQIRDGSGNPRSESAVENRFLFQGRDYLKEGAIYDYRNRFYLPALGRFIQPDPIGFKGDSGNLYRYCGNDPVDRSDPMGLLSGFREYRLEYDPNEKRDATHDGYQVAGVPGTENRPGDNLHLEVDRSVTTVKNIDGTKKGGDTNVTETVSMNGGGTPTIHQQIDVRYASGAGPKTREFTQNNEWTHSRDAINSANRLRGELGGWIRGQNMSPSAAYNLVRDGGRFGPIKIPSLQQHRDSFMSNQRIKWDDKYAPNGWRTPNGMLVAPHNPIDPYTGNPLEWNQ
jgi:RHS repeat-associated protein